MGSLFQPPDLSGVINSLLGESTASIERKNATSASDSDEARVIEGEVHFMVVPWSNSRGSERTKFEVSGCEYMLRCTSLYKTNSVCFKRRSPSGLLNTSAGFQ